MHETRPICARIAPICPDLVFYEGLHIRELDGGLKGVFKDLFFALPFPPGEHPENNKKYCLGFLVVKI